MTDVPGAPRHFEGGVALVTGASSGFAGSLAAGLADLGMSVALIGAAAGPGTAWAGPLTEVGRLDDRAGVERAFLDAVTDSGSPDLVVHAYCDPHVLRRRPLGETAEDEWIAGCEVPLRAARCCLQAAFRVMRGRGGAIVMVTPTAGMTGMAGLVPYAAVSEGTRAMVKSVARAWGRYGIRVNCVAPPVDLLGPAGREAGGEDGAASPGELWAGAFPGIPDVRADVAPVVAALAGGHLRQITGATLVIDGGVLMTT